MSVALKIQDETSSGGVISENIIHFPSDRITVKDLIHARVTQEIEAFNSGANERFVGLVQPTESEIMLNGFKVRKGNNINIEKQIKIAIDAFKSNGYFLLVNDKQVTELDEKITVTPNTVVGFIKLIPLVGG